jgi:hypothetical protein
LAQEAERGSSGSPSGPAQLHGQATRRRARVPCIVSPSTTYVNRLAIVSTWNPSTSLDRRPAVPHRAPMRPAGSEAGA